MNRDDRRLIIVSLVRRLIAAQFPHWEELPVRRVADDGWDNSTFRLGDDMKVRLPTAARYVAQVTKDIAGFRDWHRCCQFRYLRPGVGRTWR